MKSLLSIAAAFAALTSASGAASHDRGPGHWEWQKRPLHGPSKANLQSPVRVWVGDTPTKTVRIDRPRHSKR